MRGYLVSNKNDFDSTNKCLSRKYSLTSKGGKYQLASTKQVNLLLIKHDRSSGIQTSKKGWKQYSDTTPYEVSKYYLKIKLTGLS